MVYTSLQFTSFAFTPATMPTLSKEFRDTIAFVQDSIWFSSAGLFRGYFVATECAVCLFVVAVMLQDSVQLAAFLHPEKAQSAGWKYSRLALGGYMQACATVFFIPIAKTLVRAVDCTQTADGAWRFDTFSTEPDASDGSSSRSWSSGGGVEMECWVGAHWWYVGTGASLFVLYVAASVRLLAVGGEVGSLAGTRNLCAWSGDSRRDMPYAHPFSLSNPVHGTITTLGKLLVVGAQVGRARARAVGARRSRSCSQ